MGGGWCETVYITDRECASNIVAFQAWHRQRNVRHSTARGFRLEGCAEVLQELLQALLRPVFGNRSSVQLRCVMASNACQSSTKSPSYLPSCIIAETALHQQLRQQQQAQIQAAHCSIVLITQMRSVIA